MLKVLKGMKDVLPADSARWRALEREMRKAALMAGYREIRTPVLEHTEHDPLAKAAMLCARKCIPFWTRATEA